MRTETAPSRISSLSMVPTFIGGKFPAYYDPLWAIPAEDDLHEILRGEMVEKGLSKD